MQDRYLGIIIDEADRLQGLTDNLLKLNQYGAKGYYINRTEFDLAALIRKTSEAFDGRCREKNLALEMELPDEGVMVQADQERIAQVLHNLIDNAIKFSNTDSKIVVSTDERNGKIYTSVRDYGVGIPRDSLNKIWERFYKTDPSRGKDKRGTGLGLPIVKEIMEAHQENINVISTEGVGTEFIFSLPRA
jgi:signal transduction histidine kinase